MRPIKFRLWDKYFKFMDYDFSKDYLITDDGKVLEKVEKRFADQCWNEYEEDKNCVLMQYIGLKDKNGNEIYEGDIVRYKQRNLEKAFGMNDGGDDFVLKYRKIEFRDQSFNVPAGFIKDLEIIGNIYETIEKEATQ